MRDIFAMCLFIGLFFTYIPISGSGGFFLVPTIMIAMIVILLVGKINREKSRKRMTTIAVFVIVLSVFYMIAPERASDWYGSTWEFVTGKEFVPRGSKKVKYVEENGDPCIMGKDGKPAQGIYGDYTVVKNNQNDNQSNNDGVIRKEHALGYGHVDIYPGETKEFSLPTPLIRIVGDNRRYDFQTNSPNPKGVRFFKRNSLNGRDIPVRIRDGQVDLSDVRILHVEGEGKFTLNVY
jgi:hypothetical protein